jgi:hypothetical protein
VRPIQQSMGSSRQPLGIWADVNWMPQVFGRPCRMLSVPCGVGSSLAGAAHEWVAQATRGDGDAVHAHPRKTRPYQEWS